MFSPSVNRWNAVGGKLYVLAQIEAVHGLDETDAADLKEVIHALAAARKLLDHRQHQPEIARDQRLPCLLVAGPGLFQQRARLGGLQHRQLRRVHPADLDLSLHEKHHSLLKEWC